jgi:tRNA-Thr(GGU) m(6)t(6)A37 methyltransferase TsaA
MENNIKIESIGTVHSSEDQFYIELEKEYVPALTNIEGFTHLQILWWGHLYTTPEMRQHLIAEKPYKKGPDKLGVFATRSPVRPNPVLLTNVFVISVDHTLGRIYTPWIDAEDGTPVLDIKPYHGEERIKEYHVPEWCKHWPSWYEESATFAWEEEFNF